MEILPPVPDRNGYPTLSDEALAAFRLLGNPIYLYSFITQRVCWANQLALGFWNATSEAELISRPLTPYSDATRTRLDEYREAFRHGEERVESWTLYPKGVATPILCRCQGVSIAGHAEAMLVEIITPDQFRIPPVEIRALEALRHTPLMISLYSESGEVLMRNPAATACFGALDLAQPPGGDHLAAMFASRSDLDMLLDQARRDREGRRDVAIALDSGPIHSVHLTLVSDPVTGAAARLVAQRDITPLIQANRQLAASEDALDAVLNVDLAPIVVLAAGDNAVLNANLSARQLLGAGVVAGAAGEDLFVDPEDCAAFREAVLAGSGSARQVPLKAPDGTPFWASLTGLRITYERQDAVVFVVTDVDRLYRNAANLEAALSTERNALEMQRRFLAIASHEFRTPLALIDSVAQRLGRAAETMTPEQIRARAQRIRGTIKRLLQLLESIIERARDNQASLGYQPRLADLGEIVERVAATFRDSHRRMEIAVRLPTLPPLMLDPTLIEQVLTNLLSNAIKYADGTPRVEIAGTVTSADVQLSVRDWGIGIPEEERERIFSDYVRGSNVGTTPGTGLGLAIVSQILGLHGGTIELVGEPGPGTTMRITLPRP